MTGSNPSSPSRPSNPSILLAGGKVVAPEGVLDPGWIKVADGRIEAVGAGQPAEKPATDLGGQWVLPGFVDTHVHGGGGGSFTHGGSDEAARVAAFHREHGTTTMVASLVTASVGELETRVAMLADLAGQGVITGIHLEGPFLSPARCGAQDTRYMIAPDQAVFDRLREASQGRLRMITIAPELPGAAELIRAVARAGVTAAIGHTDASAEVTAGGIAAGATHATHLFNGMRPFLHRDPGPVGSLLDSDVTCELIADGVHLHETAIRVVFRAIGAERLVLVTDAMAAAGMADGYYELGPQRVRVLGGVARLAPADGAESESAWATSAIAGSTATMADCVRHAVTVAGLPVQAVALAASTNPARVLGIGGTTGALRPGLAANLVVCGDDFRLHAVLARGEWVGAAP